MNPKAKVFAKPVSLNNLVFDFYGLRMEARQQGDAVLVRYSRAGHTQAVVLPKADMDIRKLRSRLEGAITLLLPAGGSVAFHAASWPQRRKWLEGKPVA